MYPLKKITSCVFLSLLFIANQAFACTGIRITTKDGSVIYGRTLEFPSLDSHLIFVPRNIKYIGTTQTNVQDGKQWQVKYAFTGISAYNYPQIVDGVNEKGLAVGLFYFPDYADYPALTAENKSQALAPWELGTYLLSNFQNIEEIKKGLETITVAPVVLKEANFVLPVHYIVHDAEGKSLVIEYVKGQLKTYDNPLGVITNAPAFSWHLTNLSNYVNLTVNNVPPLELTGTQLVSFGQGSGLRGLPGDFTPPSRFIRAAVFSEASVPVVTGLEGVLTVFHILNQFDIPKGSIKDIGKDKSIIMDYTLWTSVSNLKDRIFYFRTYQDQQVRKVELMKMNLDDKKISTFPMTGEQVIQDAIKK